MIIFINLVLPKDRYFFFHSFLKLLEFCLNLLKKTTDQNLIFEIALNPLNIKATYIKATYNSGKDKDWTLNLTSNSWIRNITFWVLYTHFSVNIVHCVCYTSCLNQKKPEKSELTVFIPFIAEIRNFCIFEFFGKSPMLWSPLCK